MNFNSLYPEKRDILTDVQYAGVHESGHSWTLVSPVVHYG
jgi:hypothetical protein